MGATLLCELGLFYAVLTIEPSWSSFFTGEFVTFKCDMNEGKDTDWYYQINKDGQEFVPYDTNKDYKLQITSTHDSADKPRATLTAGTTIIPVGGSVTLTCSVQSSDGWKYEWFRRTQRTSEDQIRDQQNRDIRVSQGGIYSCRGTRGNPVYYTDISDDVTIEITSVSSSSFLVLMISGLIFGVIFILLLFLFLYKKVYRKKGSPDDQRVSQDENQQQVYSSLLHG
ncbi:gap junction delta-2 protein [Sarotherodon galilaeus]